MSPLRRTLLLFGGLVVLLALIGIWQGGANVTLILAQSVAYALIALGLNIQFGYGGLSNLGTMGFMMLGGFAVTFISYPLNLPFWHSDGPAMLARALAVFVVGLLLVAAARRVDRLGIRGGWKALVVLVAWFVAYVAYRSQIDPAADYIEKSSGWVGGLGLNPLLGWAFGGVLAAVIAVIIGRITLGLRSDYLAIATIGIGEIIRAFIKNMDWLTRGTLTVSPIPWPTPLPQQLQADGMSISQSFVVARLGFIAVAVVIFAVVFFLVERAYRGPWGRMMRAIRDNFIAADSMGKDVTRRQLEIFVLGSLLMGVGGAMLVSFNQILDPTSYQPITHNFMFWVMVIVGGAGNNWGTILGSVLIYTVWVVSDPVSQFIFHHLSDFSVSLGWGAIPEIDTRSVQMRVFVLGLVIWLALRYAPKGLLPEVLRGGGKAGASPPRI